MTHSNEVIVNTVNRFYPGIIAEVTEKLKSMIPESLTDINKLPEIVNLFCQVKGIDQKCITGRTIPNENCKYRRELLAVVIMFYQPAKLLGLSKERMRINITPSISEILKCRQNNISKIISEIIVHYKCYERFKNSVSDTYEEIKKKLKQT